MFYDDAETASRVLGLTLTSRNNGGAAEVPLAGVPVKALPGLPAPTRAAGLSRRDLRAGGGSEAREGHRAARGRRDGHAGRGVRRRAARRQRATTSSARCGRGTRRAARPRRAIGVAAADVSTGELRLCVTHRRRARCRARSLRAARDPAAAGLASSRCRASRSRGARHRARGVGVRRSRSRARISRASIGVLSLDGLGIGEPTTAGGRRGRRAAALPARAAARRACRSSRGRSSSAPAALMPLDEMTRRNLELVESLRGGGAGRHAALRARSHGDADGRTAAAAVAARAAHRSRGDRRATRRRVERSSTMRSRARRCATRSTACATSSDSARRPPPAERRRASSARSATSLAALPAVAAARQAARRRRRTASLDRLLAEWDDCAELASRDLVDARRAPAARDRRRARRSRRASTPSSTRCASCATAARTRSPASRPTERARTGIASLKVGFNKVFGYYIEITNANLHLVPADYQRRQTITTGERFVTPALKEYEETVLTRGRAHRDARARAVRGAARRGRGARSRVCSASARALAELDVLATLADVAAREGYVRPTITDDFALEIAGGRHPVVERMMPRDKFIPNDVRLTRRRARDHPHRPEHGRQVDDPAADRADRADGADRELRAGERRRRVGVVDRVFTRVGASDNLVRGQSTFMVEMARRAPSCTRRRRAASCCSTRSAAARRRTTACRSRGR